MNPPWHAPAVRETMLQDLQTVVERVLGSVTAAHAATTVMAAAGRMMSAAAQAAGSAKTVSASVPAATAPETGATARNAVGDAVAVAAGSAHDGMACQFDVTCTCSAFTRKHAIRTVSF
jgi:hypothetical protein